MGLSGLFGENPYNVRDLVATPTGGSTCPEELMLRSGMAAVNAKGKKGSSDLSAGQDNFSVSHLGNGWRAASVMDGHGEAGHWLATRVAQALPSFLRGAGCAAMLRAGEAHAALLRAFQKAEADLEQYCTDNYVNLDKSGCTVVCVLWREAGDRVWVAHVGDSRAVLMQRGMDACSTKDHKLTVPAERQRITSMGGQIFCRRHRDGFLEERVYREGRTYPGLCVTRSFGDLCLRDSGVIAQPEVVEWHLRGRGGVLLIATDGLWEVLRVQDVIRSVRSGFELGKTHDEVLDDLLEQAQSAWEVREGDYCDDVTLVLVALDAPHLEWPTLPLKLLTRSQESDGWLGALGCVFTCVMRPSSVP